jgi:hypothetical protein
MQKRLALSAAIGAAVFAALSPLAWGLYVFAFVASAIAGGVIGCAGGGIGELVYWLARGREDSGPLSCTIHCLLAAAAGGGGARCPPRSRSTARTAF